jgi:outer membrane protein TolC
LRVLPAAERARDSAITGYESGRTEIMAVLTAEQTVVDTRTELAASKASLDHALIELDFITGAPVRRVPAATQKSESKHDR